MPEATMQAIEYAKKYDVPVVLTLGTRFVIQDDPEYWQDFLKQHVSVVAMNEDEAEALTGEKIHWLLRIKHLIGLILFYVLLDQSVYLWLVIQRMLPKEKLRCHYCQGVLLNLTDMNLADLL